MASTRLLIAPSRRPIELDGVMRIAQEVRVGLDAIRHVRVGEDPARQEIGQALGMVLPGKLEQGEQVNDLMVAPVADERPWIPGSGTSQSIPRLEIRYGL
jgi:hypothetical protein